MKYIFVKSGVVKESTNTISTVDELINTVKSLYNEPNVMSNHELKVSYIDQSGVSRMLSINKDQFVGNNFTYANGGRLLSLNEVGFDDVVGDKAIVVAVLTTKYDSGTDLDDLTRTVRRIEDFLQDVLGELDTLRSQISDIEDEDDSYDEDEEDELDSEEYRTYQALVAKFGTPEPAKPKVDVNALMNRFS